MPITVRQIATCVGAVPSTITAFIRSGELNAVKTENRKYAITKEDLADFFTKHPSFWRRFLTTPQQKKYLEFRKIILKAVGDKAGRRGPLYYTLSELAVLFDVRLKSLRQMANDGCLRIIKENPFYYVREEDVIELMQKNPEYFDSLQQYETKTRWMKYLKDRLVRLYEEGRNEDD